MNKETVTIQIGNSDDKLTQKQWSQFIKDIRDTLEVNQWNEIHFSAGSENYKPWQNFCWVIVIERSEIYDLKQCLTVIRKEYGQDSIAVTRGTTEFI